MQKDVIYIDVEDDITAIISKVKAAEKTVVALVPPKRIGVLQSAVNLQLLARAAKQNHKKLALVTANQALIALARAASIPVAKNLQSKPELVEANTDDETDTEDIIDGAELPVGEHARQSHPLDAKQKSKSAAIQELFDDTESNQADFEPKEEPSQKKKKSVNIPDFNKFRKRLVLGIVAGVGLVVFLVWAIVFAPRATVLISAKTTSSSINTPVTIRTGAKTDYDKAVLQATEVTDSEEKSITFEPTGEKDVGKKATGTVNYSNSSLSGKSIPAGTELASSSGATFITDSEVSVPGASFPCGNITCPSPGTASGSVTASENGSKYNGATGAVSGEPSNISGQFADPTSGGVTKIVDIVTEADVQKAKQQLADENTDAISNDLTEKFDSGVTAIPESFAISYKNVESSPAVGEEASSASLTATVVYTVYGVEKSELDTFLDAYLKDELKDVEGQQVYENGASEVVFQEAGKRNNGASATLVATAQIGPQIKDSDVKAQARGKRYGEIQEAFTSVQGVEKVDVKFFPFWVSTVPNDDKKITVEFTIDESQ